MVSLFTTAAVLAYYRLRQRKRRFGVHPILRKRKEFGHFHGLFKDLQGDPQRFHRFVRMDAALFKKLLGLVEHRHSRARRMIESTFGLLCARWRILLRPIETSVLIAELIVQAVVCLHNFLVDELGDPFASFANADATQECPLSQAPMQHPNAHRARRDAEEVRAKLIEFVNGVGAVDWQEASALVGPTQATADSDDDDASQGGLADAETQDDGGDTDASEEL